MRNTWMLLAIATFCVLALTAIRVGAQSVRPTGETYSWSGELVSVDANARTITVKSRVFGDQALKELQRFKPGERIVLTWSGFDTYADAISRAVRYDAARNWSERFTFPVEFVAYDAARQYLAFKVQVPADSLASLDSLRPGEWITATARHRATTDAEAIASVSAYTASASRASTE